MRWHVAPNPSPRARARAPGTALEAGIANKKQRQHRQPFPREDFRPFAPSVLAEEAEDWFEGLPPDGRKIHRSLITPRGKNLRIGILCAADVFNYEARLSVYVLSTFR